MQLTDSQVTRAIISAAKTPNVTIDYRAHGGKFRTVYIEASEKLPFNEQRDLLAKLQMELLTAGVTNVKMTRFNNPPFLNRNTGKYETGHPRHGHPFLEIESVWWIPSKCEVTFYAKGDEEMNNMLTFCCEAFSEDEADAKCLGANPGCTTTSVEWEETPGRSTNN